MGEEARTRRTEGSRNDGTVRSLAFPKRNRFVSELRPSAVVSVMMAFVANLQIYETMSPRSTIYDLPIYKPANLRKYDLPFYYLQSTNRRVSLQARSVYLVAISFL